MNPVLASALGAILRWGLNLLVPFLVANGIWTPEESTAYVAAATTSLLTLIWILYTKYKDRIKFINALEAPAGTPEDVVKAKPAPSISSLMHKFVFLLMVGSLGFSVTACGGGAVMNTARYSAEASTIALKAQELVIEADKSGLQPNKDLTAKAMAAFRNLGQQLQTLAAALRAYDTMTDNAGKTAQAQKITDLLQEARRLTRVVMMFVGNDGVGQQLALTFDNLDRIFDEVTKALAK